MTKYRRNRVPGGTYCFTVNLLDRGSRLLVDQIGSLRGAVRRVRKVRPFHIDAWVVLPEHMHCLLTLPAGDADYSTRLRLIKAIFSRSLTLGEGRSASRAVRRERGIWQRRFWEHTIRDDADYAVHMDYIHFNPVKHRLVAHPADWPFSTFQRCIARGLYPADWATPDANSVKVGERRTA